MSRTSSARRRYAAASLALVAALGAGGCSDGDAAVETSAAPSSAASPSSATSPTIAPGTVLVFQRDGIWVNDLDGGADVELAPDLSDGEHPDWSPDGSTILFETAFSTLWTVPSTGGDAAAIVSCVAPCANVYEGAWSPDGSSIAYAMVETEDGTNTARSSIQVLDLVTGTSRAVYEDSAGTVWLFTPRWSPDGESIVFTESTFASTRLDESEIRGERIAVVDIGESTSTYLTPEDRVSNSPDWSPAGDLIVFAGEDNILSIRPDGSGLTPVTSFDGQQEHAIQPSFLPDGSGVVFTYVTGTFGVDDRPRAAVVGLDGNGFVVLDVASPATHPRGSPA